MVEGYLITQQWWDGFIIGGMLGFLAMLMVILVAKFFERFVD